MEHDHEYPNTNLVRLAKWHLKKPGYTLDHGCGDGEGCGEGEGGGDGDGGEDGAVPGWGCKKQNQNQNQNQNQASLELSKGLARNV